MEIVHNGKTTLIFYHAGKYYECKPDTYIKLLLKEFKIEETLTRKVTQ